MFLLQMRLGRRTFRVYRVKQRFLRWVTLEGVEHGMARGVNRSPTPFQRRVRRVLIRISPWFRYQPLPTDYQRCISFFLPFPKGSIGIDIYRHPRQG